MPTSCNNCGKENPSGSRFCQSCGTPLAQRPASAEVAAMLVCRSCGTANAPGMKFCKSCGAGIAAQEGKPAKVVCPACGGHTPFGYKFCQHCGSPLPDDAPAAADTKPPTADPEANTNTVISKPTPHKKPAPGGGSEQPTITNLEGKKDPPAFTPPAGMPPGAPPGAPPPGAPPPGAPPTASPAAVVSATPSPQAASASASAPPPPETVPKPRTPTAASADSPPPTAVRASVGSSSAAVIGAPSKPTPPPVAPPVVAPPADAPSESNTSIQAAKAPPKSVAPSSEVMTSASSTKARPAKPTSGPGNGTGLVSSSTMGRGQMTVGPGAARAAAKLDTKQLARLISVRRDGTDGDVHSITEEAVDLGRTAGQLIFDDDPYLADRHCRFAIKDGKWHVQDLGTANGVYLRISEPHALQPSDRLLLGKQVLHFERLSESERNLAPAVENGVMIFGSPLRQPWARLRQITVAGIARDIYYLYRTRVIIGREDGDLIFPDDEFMSRQHLALSVEGEKAQVEDLGSSNGTFLRVAELVPLDTGDMLRIGDQLLRFELA